MLKQLIKFKKPTLPCSSVMVTYKSKNGSWRGFVLPYDVTYEADTKEEVMSVLKDMRSSYEEGLKKYDSLSHLAEVPLTYEEDNEKLQEISGDLFNKLLTNHLVIKAPSYYAEAKLPA